MARASGSFADALRTTAVMGGLLLVAFVVGLVVTVKPEGPVRHVDLADAVTGARAATTFELWAPAELPDGWTATSARFGPKAWHLGVVTDGDRYVGLEQATVSTSTLIKDFAAGSRAVGTTTIKGLRWQVRTEPDGDRIYVRDLGESSVLVIGSAPQADLERYVASLSAS